MPLSPAVADPSTTQPDGEPQPDSVPAVYEALVASLLVLLAGYLAPKPGVPSLSWPWAAMARLPRFRSDVQRALNDLSARLDGLVEAGMGRAVAHASAEAARDVRRPVGVPDVAAWRVRVVVDVLRSTHLRAAAVLEDAYRAAVAAAARAVGDPTPEIQRVLDDFAGRGVTGFVDRAGRRWSLETYVEMTVRWHYADAALAEYVRVATQAGVRFARVSVNHSEHAACLAWEGKVVSLDWSPRGSYTVRTPGGRDVVVEVAGTLQESRAAGVWHPHCQHRLTAVLPGGGVRARAVPAVDRVARAEARYRRRTARAWDRKGRVALTGAARVRAVAGGRRWRNQHR